MQLEITAIDDGYRLEGELDMATAGGLTELFLAASGGDTPLVLDFSGVSFMDSSGLRALLEGAGLPNGGRTRGRPGRLTPGAPRLRDHHPGRGAGAGDPSLRAPTRSCSPGYSGSDAGVDSTTWSGVWWIAGTVPSRPAW